MLRHVLLLLVPDLLLGNRRLLVVVVVGISMVRLLRHDEQGRSTNKTSWAHSATRPIPGPPDLAHCL